MVLCTADAINAKAFAVLETLEAEIHRREQNAICLFVSRELVLAGYRFCQAVASGPLASLFPNSQSSIWHFDFFALARIFENLQAL
jgi:hypothetical protein